jgi:hypothetical protein
VLLKDHGTTYTYSHLVIASEFSMLQTTYKQKGGMSVYQLSESNLNQLKAIVESRRQLCELESSDESDSDSSDGNNSIEVSETEYE